MNKEQLKDEIRKATLAGDKTTQYLKMILGEVERKENDLTKPVVATEEVILDVIKKLANSMKENIKYSPSNEQFKEEYEFYSKFLPKTMSKEEASALIKKLAIENNITSKKDKGSLMKLVKAINGINMAEVGPIVDSILI